LRVILSKTMGERGPLCAEFPLSPKEDTPMYTTVLPRGYPYVHHCYTLGTPLGTPCYTLGTPLGTPCVYHPRYTPVYTTLGTPLGIARYTLRYTLRYSPVHPRRYTTGIYPRVRES